MEVAKTAPQAGAQAFPEDETVCYGNLLAGMREAWQSALDSGLPIFRAEHSNSHGTLFSAYLNTLPADRRQAHDCMACAGFMRRYGTLVTVGPSGELTSAVWPTDTSGLGIYARFAEVVHEYLSHPNVAVREPLILEEGEKDLGDPGSDGWVHFHLDASALERQRVPALSATGAAGVLGELATTFTMARKMNRVSAAAMEKALSLLDASGASGLERFREQLRWAIDFRRGMGEISGQVRLRNFVWRESMMAPLGFPRLENNAVGKLVEDVQDGRDASAALAAFLVSVDPLNHKRPKALPSAGNVTAAEKFFQEKGLGDSLRRRFAFLAEVPKVGLAWTPTLAGEAQVKGLFSGLRTKDGVRSAESDAMLTGFTGAVRQMSWRAFREKLLPQLHGLELEIDTGAKLPFAAIATEAVQGSKPILRWDAEGRRNPFSWYVHAERVAASAQGLGVGQHPVAAVVLLPNLWYAQRDSLGEGYLIVLHGRSEQFSVGPALFKDMMNSALAPFAPTLEQFTREKRMEDNPSGTQQLFGVAVHEGTRGLRFSGKDASGARHRVEITAWE